VIQRHGWNLLFHECLSEQLQNGGCVSALATRKDRSAVSSFFLRFDSKTWIIIFAWVNDENTLRSSGSKSDPYTVFQRMLERGHPPDDSPPDALVSWEALGDERDERHGRFLPQPPRPHDRVAPRVGPVTPPHLFTSARRWVKKPWKRCFSKPSMWPSP